MNRLPRDKQIQIITALVEGCSIRSIERMYDVHRDTVSRLMVRTGMNCMTIMDDLMQDIPTGVYQCDEIWCFVRKKDKRLRPHEKSNPEIGSQFIFIAMEAETKLIPSWRIGKRVPEVAYGLMVDLADRMNGGRPTVITDGFGPYLDAVDAAFGVNVDFAQLVKVVSEIRKPAQEGYMPATVVRCYRMVVTGRPHRRQISTSLIERQNLTVRMSMRRLTRLTNAFSKKLDNLKAATALHFAHYNLCRIHKTIRVTPAMAAGIVNTIWDIPDLLA
jgi:IS1 family transposase